MEKNTFYWNNGRIDVTTPRSRDNNGTIVRSCDNNETMARSRDNNETMTRSRDNTETMARSRDNKGKINFANLINEDNVLEQRNLAHILPRLTLHLYSESAQQSRRL